MRTLPIIGLSLAAAMLLGCGRQPPPRPVPPPENVPELPPWYPEQPFNLKGEGGRTFFEGKVVFHTDKSSIRPESEAVLRKLLTWLQENPDVSRLRLEGHTDSRDTDEYNQGLSERRAVAVADWLVDHGLDHTRLLAVAFGETRPLTRNDTAAGRQENRRTSFFPAEIAGRRFDEKDPTNGGLVLTVLSKEEREALKKKGKVPKVKLPPVNPERDIIKPLTRERKLPLDEEVLGSDKGPIIDASKGTPVTKPEGE